MTAISPPLPQQADASCRWPLFVLFGGGAVWLVLSSVFGLIASIQFHSPEFLADAPALTYGHVRPAWSNALVYGFSIPAGLGVGLWLLARLGRVRVAGPGTVLAGAALWHLGVLVGLMGILAGDSTGFAWFEMPRYAAVVLLPAFLLIALAGVVTHRSRSRRWPAADSSAAQDRRAVPMRTEAPYPSQGFVLAALLWFPWIYTTTVLLLLVHPVRGMVQASVGWWFSGNLLVVWTGLAGLASAFYFLSKLGGQPLQSRHLALFTFLTLLLFGTWVGIPAGAPLPAWMPVLSGVGAALMLVPALAVATSAVLTLRGASPGCGGDPLRFIKFGIGSFVLAGVMLATSAVPPVNRLTAFTWFGHAETALRLHGFFAMTMFGAIYDLVPRIARFEFPFVKLIRVHFWCGAIGTLGLVAPLAIGGVMQGFNLANANIAFLDVTRSTLMFLRISTLGDTLLLLGHILFLLNVGGLIARHGRAVWTTAWQAATARLDSAEAQP